MRTRTRIRTRIGRPTAALVLAACLAPAAGTAQQAPPARAHASEEVRELTTYPFDEPDRVPLLARDERLYPYHAFEGYAADPVTRSWKVVRLSNDLVDVFILPEVGGKVWGAVVRRTGHEFIYRNEVLKFRNIALRGPWTSGGIEFNFGVIGHTPATATPVDYVLRDNPDGSASCIVGALDLPSRTQWRVEIRLPAGAAYVETRALWFNPTPYHHPYYNWMTAAAFARPDLEMTIPGTAYLEHGGRAHPWPVDSAGRNLARYADNTFGGHKSYHVVGTVHDFFGGYYADDDYGFGHWARYEDMPGQKLWLWALSREGGIWEDLLTDTDGQYVEFQAGRMLVQYAAGQEVNPVREAGFAPLSASRWRETWFGVEGTGGLSEASRLGALHVTRGPAAARLTLQSFVSLRDTLQVWSGGRLLERRPVELEPLTPLRSEVSLPSGAPLRVVLPRLELEYDSDPAARALQRPFTTDPAAWSSMPEARRLVFEGWEKLEARRLREAGALFRRAVSGEPWQREARLGLAELELRSGRPAEALDHLRRVLEIDAYDADANFLAGIAYRALGRWADTRDALGWAARSPAYRAAAWAALAEAMITARRWRDAEVYARRSLDYDAAGIPALRALAIIGRTRDDVRMGGEARAALLRIDPLHHFARAEAFLHDGTTAARAALLRSVGGEYPDQTWLELVATYAGLDRRSDALAVAELALEAAAEAHRTTPVSDTGPDAPAGAQPALWGAEPLLRAWRAYLRQDPTLLPRTPSLDFAFPYRPETLPVLTWAAEATGSWRWAWLRALNLWALRRDVGARSILEGLGNEPDFAPLYVARSALLERSGTDPLPDLRRAVALDPDDRLLHVRLVRALEGANRWEGALDALDAARARFPDDFNLMLLQARALNELDRPDESLALLGEVRVLPSENARESHLLWETAHLLAALRAMEGGAVQDALDHLDEARQWPEHLGQGRPYRPEERLVRFVEGAAHFRLGRAADAAAAWRAVIEAEAADDAVPPAGAGPAELRRAAAEALRRRSAEVDDARRRLIERALGLAGEESGR